MSAPALSTFAQGLGSVSADNLLTFEQTCDTFAQLRGLTGKPGLQVFSRGGLAIADGLQGTFYWNSTTTALDDGNSIIKPTGSGSTGAWVRITPVGVGLQYAITYVIDGGGSVINTGIAGQLYIPFGCTITAATLLADQSGSVVVDVWKAPLASYPPTISNSIVASDPPTLSGAAFSQDTALTGWRSTVNAADVLMFNINSAATITRLTIALTASRS